MATLGHRRYTTSLWWNLLATFVCVCAGWRDKQMIQDDWTLGHGVVRITRQKTLRWHVPGGTISHEFSHLSKTKKMFPMWLLSKQNCDNNKLNSLGNVFLDWVSVQKKIDSSVVNKRKIRKTKRLKDSTENGMNFSEDYSNTFNKSDKLCLASVVI